MTTDKPVVSVRVSSTQHSGARVTIEPPVPAGDINKHIDRDGISLFSKDGMTFIRNSSKSQVPQFMPLVVDALKAAGYEVVEVT